MADLVVGVRLDPGSPLLFCQTALEALECGRRVRVALGDEVREAVVAIAPGQIVAAPPLGDAPRVVDEVSDERVPDERGAEEVPAGIAFFPAGEDGVGVGDLRRALDLAARPIAPPPPERRSLVRNQGALREGASTGTAGGLPATVGVGRLEAGGPGGDGPIHTNPSEETLGLRSVDD